MRFHRFDFQKGAHPLDQRVDLAGHLGGGHERDELVQVVPGPNPENVVAYLKREKPE